MQQGPTGGMPWTRRFPLHAHQPPHPALFGAPQWLAGGAATPSTSSQSPRSSLGSPHLHDPPLPCLWMPRIVAAQRCSIPPSEKNPTPPLSPLSCFPQSVCELSPLVHLIATSRHAASDRAWICAAEGHMGLVRVVYVRGVMIFLVSCYPVCCIIYDSYEHLCCDL